MEFTGCTLCVLVFKCLINPHTKRTFCSSKLDRLDKLSQDFESKETCSVKVTENLAETVNRGILALFSNTASKDL